MGQDVHQVLTIKYPLAYCNTLINHCHSWCMIWYGTQWYCWPTSSFPWIHLYWLVYAVAKSHSDCRHHDRNGSLSLCRQLDRTIWRSIDTLKWQGVPVWFELLKRTDVFTRFKMYPHHSIPSKLQWPSGTIPPTVQGFTQGSCWPISLVWKSTNGSSWHLNSAKGGPALHCLQTGLWYHFTTTRWIFQ